MYSSLFNAYANHYIHIKFSFFAIFLGIKRNKNRRNFFSNKMREKWTNKKRLDVISSRKHFVLMYSEYFQRKYPFQLVHRFQIHGYIPKSTYYLSLFAVVWVTKYEIVPPLITKWMTKRRNKEEKKLYIKNDNNHLHHWKSKQKWGSKRGK